jgi:type I restriction enzyme S subunit
MPAVDEVRGCIARPEVRLFIEIQKGYTYFAEGDVLFAKITPCMQNGKHAVAHDLIDGIGFGSTEFHVIRPLGEIQSSWIHLFIRQPYVLQNAIANFTGAVGQQRVPEGFLSDLNIPIPPLIEQKRITAILNEQMAAVEQARTAAEKQREAAKVLPAAYLRRVFPQPGQELPKGWRWVNFGETVNNFDGRRVPVKHSDRIKGPYPYYGASGIIDYVNTFLFDGEYLLVAEDGANLIMRSTPIAFKASGKFWVNNHAHIVKPKSDVHIDYLLHYLASISVKEFVTGAAQPKMTQDDMNRIPVPLPSFDEQKRIISTLNGRLATVETLQASVNVQLSEINALPAAILRQAFNGEL